MSMSTYVVGVIPANEKFDAMKEIWDLCEAQDIIAPEEVLDFFNGETPDEAGIVKQIQSTEYSGEMEAGLEVDITKLPKDVTIIRFYNSY